jgi:nucleotide-binding universal stress UspA family protein
MNLLAPRSVIMPWKPIIVGVDGAPESLRAAELAAKIAAAAHAPLIPVHAVPVIPAFTGVSGIEPVPIFAPELQDTLVRSSREQIARALEQVLAPTAVRRLEVQTGPAPFVLAEAARKWKAELVVLGGKQHGALARGLGRSTAHYLVRTLDVPILVVGASAAPITNVLAAVDLSIASVSTMKTAERLAALFGGRVRLLHVVEPMRFTYLAPDQWDEPAYERRSHDAFERFASPFKDISSEDRVVLHGLPAETIAEEAEAWHADVVVVGSHGKGWVDRVLVGSTTERLVTQLPTSILVVPLNAIGETRVTEAQRRTARHPARRGAKAHRQA